MGHMKDEPTKSTKEPRVSCRVTPELMGRLERIAAANGIDVSDVVRMALNRALPNYEQDSKPTQPLEQAA